MKLKSYIHFPISSKYPDLQPRSSSSYSTKAVVLRTSYPAQILYDFPTLAYSSAWPWQRAKRCNSHLLLLSGQHLLIKSNYVLWGTFLFPIAFQSRFLLRSTTEIHLPHTPSRRLQTPITERPRSHHVSCLALTASWVISAFETLGEFRETCPSGRLIGFFT